MYLGKVVAEHMACWTYVEVCIWHVLIEGLINLIYVKLGLVGLHVKCMAHCISSPSLSLCQSTNIDCSSCTFTFKSIPCFTLAESGEKNKPVAVFLIILNIEILFLSQCICSCFGRRFKWKPYQCYPSVINNFMGGKA